MPGLFCWIYRGYPRIIFLVSELDRPVGQCSLGIYAEGVIPFDE